MPETSPSTQSAADILVEMLSESSVHIRRMAVWELATQGNAHAVEHLLPMLHMEPDWECRHYIVMSLARLGDARALPTLRSLLETDYLEPDHHGPAGPAPADLAAHIRDDVAYAIMCVTEGCPPDDCMARR
jgi:HEAT repeat protein